MISRRVWFYISFSVPICSFCDCVVCVLFTGWQRQPRLHHQARPPLQTAQMWKHGSTPIPISIIQPSGRIEFASKKMVAVPGFFWASRLKSLLWKATPSRRQSTRPVSPSAPTSARAPQSLPRVRYRVKDECFAWRTHYWYYFLFPPFHFSYQVPIWSLPPNLAWRSTLCPRDVKQKGFYEFQLIITLSFLLFFALHTWSNYYFPSRLHVRQWCL